jgi:hypothetical protein
MRDDLMRILEELKGRIQDLERIEVPTVPGGAGIGGSGTPNYLAQFTAPTTIGDSDIIDGLALGDLTLSGNIPSNPTISVNDVSGVWTLGSGTITSTTLNNAAIANHTHSLDTLIIATGTYGDATHVAQTTVDAKGRITAISDVLISGVAPSAHDILSSSHGDTSAAAVTEGALMVGDATPEWSRLAHPGGAGYALVSGATGTAWDGTPYWTAGQHRFGAGLKVDDDQNITLGDGNDATIDFNSVNSEVTVDGVDWQFNVSLVDVVGAVRSSRTGVALQYTEFTEPDTNGNYLTSHSVESAKKTFYIDNVHNSAGSAAGTLDVIFRIGASAGPTSVLKIDDAAGDVELLTGDLLLPSSKGIIHADGVTAGFVLRGNGTRYIPSAIQVTDLPAHAAEHEVGGGDLVNHDSLTGFVANEHINHTSVTLTAGAGLTGGGDISANRTFAVGAGDGITVNANDVALTTPGTLTAATANSAAGNHTHAITDTSDGATNHSTILSSSAAGALTLDDLFLTDGAVVGISAADERIVFDAAGNIQILGANVGIKGAPSGDLSIVDTNTSAVFDLQRDDASVASGDGIGVIRWRGGEAATDNVGRIIVQAAADWTAASSPTDMIFSVTESGNTAFSEAMRITAALNVEITDGYLKFNEISSPSPSGANELFINALDDGGVTALQISNSTSDYVWIHDGALKTTEELFSIVIDSAVASNNYTSLRVNLGGGAAFHQWSGGKGLDNTVHTLINNGTQDSTVVLKVDWIVVRESDNDYQTGSAELTPGTDQVVYTNAGDIYNLRCNADGSVDARRTNGSDTYTANFDMEWVHP